MPLEMDREKTKTKTRWNLLTTDANIKLMSQVLGIKEITATVMANRGLRSKNTALAYLQAQMNQNNQNNSNNQMSVLDSQLGMKDAKKAFDRIIKGIRQRERIMIYGDYDADGVMSTVILYKALKACGADVYFYIPHREEEGYGLNIEAIRAIKEEEHDLLITCDNGISDLAEIAEAQNLGLDVIVIDHHEPGFVEGPETETGPKIKKQDVIPQAYAVIDPKQAACPYPFKEMCAAGLSFRLMESLYQYIGRDFSHLYNELLALAAFATICDIVDLVGENRAIVKHGLMVLNANKNLNGGLNQLITLRGYAEKPIDSFTVGFILGPCINATGRLESAEMSVQLLLSNNPVEQKKLAKTLISLNEERKDLTTSCVDRALKKIEETNDKVIVLVDKETHESIAGIVAGKIKETVHHPTIVLTRGTDTGVLKGSGRSIESYNMFEALYAHRGLFIRFGGHAMAAGMTLKEENMEELKMALNKDCTLQDVDFQDIIHIDKELTPEDITLDLAKELEWLAPFGKGNRSPLFLTRNLKITALRIIDEKNTIIFGFGNLKGIAFGLNDVFSGQAGDTIDLVHTVEANTFNGRTNVQIRVKDFRKAK